MGGLDMPELDDAVMDALQPLLLADDCAPAAALLQEATGAPFEDALAWAVRMRAARLDYDELPEARGIAGYPNIPALAEREIRRELRRGNVIAAIVRLREETDIGLFEARKLADAMRRDDL